MPPNARNQAETMGILNDLLQRVQSVNDGLEKGGIIRDVVIQYPDDILDLQKQQLFAGKRSDGEDIRPYYTEDLKPSGYFYSVDTAKMYAAWKQTLDYPFEANRNPDAPNLYINGRFHDELGVQFTVDTVAVVGTTGYSQQIVAKYGLDTFGLMWDNWNEIFFNRGGYDRLMEQIKQTLYVN